MINTTVGSRRESEDKQRIKGNAQNYMDNTKKNVNKKKARIVYDQD